MLKMNTDFKNYVDNTKFTNHKISVSSQQIIINTLSNNINLIIDYIFIAAAISLLLKIETDSLYVAAIMLFFAFVKLWKDFDTVNYIIINLTDKKVTIRSKNIIKLLFLKRKTISFSAIKTINKVEDSKLKSFTRYKLILSLKNEDEITMTDFKYMSQATIFAAKMENLIK